ncbi:hypothetical protein F2P81_017097 [Scophthalmus maximus]|uniref:Interleukin-12 subunit alpha n=1 Tax=Scophthalmus maximus TaxID=52904 RepID=A0A6A4S584_SCOMX|nr:hypothetical protein F2P81_017097 [Scophthalmus maximus]
MTRNDPARSMSTSDYREDGMDLGSDVSSRSSSESNSNKVTPCSPSLDLATLDDYKSSPSLDLVTLEDYEEDEDYQEYKKKVIEEWESEYGEDCASPQPPGLEESGGGIVEVDGLGKGYRKTVNSRSLAEEFQDVKTVPPLPAPAGHTATSIAAVPEELKQNGNLILPRSNQLHSPGTPQGIRQGTPKRSHRSSSQGRGSRSSGGGGGGGGEGGTGARMGGYREEEAAEEEPLPTMDWAALEKHLAGLQCREQENQNLNHNQNHNMGRTNYTSAQKNERESIRQKLALGSFFDDGPGIYTSCSKSGKPSLSSRLQSGMNLQICFVNDSGSDKDSDADDSKTETSLDTPLSPMSKQSSSYSDRDTTEDDSESLEDMDFLSRQKKLQAEAKLALAMAKPMAKMQVEVEKQNRKKSPVADLLPHMPHISECLMKRSLKPTDLRDMTLGQLQVIVNDLHSQIESLNEELVQLLLIRDELHMEQDAMLVDIEDLTRCGWSTALKGFHIHVGNPSKVITLILGTVPYLACCALLLTSGWRASSAHPVRAEECARCPRLFRSLLLNIKELLNSDVLCFGITSTEVVVRSEAETLLACAPTLTQNSGCVTSRNSSFSESECLRNIMKDLVYYDAAIKSYHEFPVRSPKEVALLNTTLGIIESLKDVAKMWGNDTYTNRQEMCKMMRGFYVRTITINRAMGYISSGDHRK